MTAEEITVKLHAELTLFKNGGVAAFVMMGSRCVHQSHQRDEAAARAYLAEHWGLVPREKRKRDTNG